MRINVLKRNPSVYSCNAYFIRGNWNAIQDINTLVDSGTDGFIINEIEELSTGVGKSRVEQVILTHEHFDHAGGVKYLLERYRPEIISFSNLPFTTILASDGLELRIGDTRAEILHTPGHSHDSICIYCPDEKVLFSGDTPLNIKVAGGSYSMDYVEALERIAALEIDVIYSGHDDPYTENVREMLHNTLKIVKKSKII